jgi:hypothetical protein
MKRYRGGAEVPGGYYLNLSSWELAAVPGAQGPLPGRGDESSVRVALPALLALAPMLGAAYALYLPLAGFGLVAYAVGRRLGLFARSAALDAGATISPAWRPGEAYFADGARPGGPGVARDAELDALEQEIARRRAAEPSRGL